MFASAPLPFQGQKRRHVKNFASLIKGLQPATVIDLFGGSGLLSHVAKRTYPSARVIYNDYDDYGKRLARVDATNALLREIRELLCGIRQDEKITEPERGVVLRRLARDDGYVDYITLSSSLLFSAKYAVNHAQFARQTMYNCVRSTNYSVGDYLNGLEIVRRDYRELCAQYRNVPNVLFVVDPPYLSTDTTTYNNGYWKLKDYLDVLTELQGLQFVYFTSCKSQILELCEWIGGNGGHNIFERAHRTIIQANPSYNSRYDDIMLHVR